jgi:hypothetical protein
LLRTIWYRLLLALHEMRCSGKTYNVWNGDDTTIVIHDACGQTWSASCPP